MPALVPVSVLSRRRLLGLGGGIAVAGLLGCSSDEASSTGPGSAPAVDIASEVITDEQTLIARYDAVLAAFPELGKSLASLREQHVDHAQALGGDAAPAGPVGPAPATVRDALRGLRDAERSASRQRKQACLGSQDPELTRLLALTAASEASHVAELRRQVRA